MVQISSSGAPFEKPRALRICFQKMGALQYISHLDLVRTMTRVIARAQLPIKYTEGFHPIPHLVFSAPLPVGAQSPREFLDIEVLSEVDTEEVKARLNEGLPAELSVGEVYYATTKFKEITAAEYEIRMHTANATPALAEKCVACLSEGSVVVHKRTKGGERDVDVRDAILRVRGEWCAESDELVVAVTLAAAGGSFLNPDYLVSYLKDRLGVLSGSPDEEWYHVIRTHLFCANGEDFS